MSDAAIWLKFGLKFAFHVVATMTNVFFFYISMLLLIAAVFFLSAAQSDGNKKSTTFAAKNAPQARCFLYLSRDCLDAVLEAVLKVNH